MIAPDLASSKILRIGLASKFVKATLPTNPVKRIIDLNAIANPPFIATNIPVAIPNSFNIFFFISSNFSLLPDISAPKT